MCIRTPGIAEPARIVLPSLLEWEEGTCRGPGHHSGTLRHILGVPIRQEGHHHIATLASITPTPLAPPRSKIATRLRRTICLMSLKQPWRWWDTSDLFDRPPRERSPWPCLPKQWQHRHPRNTLQSRVELPLGSNKGMTLHALSRHQDLQVMVVPSQESNLEKVTAFFTLPVSFSYWRPRKPTLSGTSIK